MAYKSLQAAVLDLERHGYLVRIREEVDPYLQMAAIHRRVNQAGGPAIYYERIKGCSVPAVSNLFGSIDQARFLFRHSLKDVQALIQAKANPKKLKSKAWSYIQAARAGLHLLPLPSLFSPPVLAKRTSISQLPLIQAWPEDGGPFITLPQVYSEDPENPGVMRSNLGMYRIQMQGNHYHTNQQVGLHYQIQRGIGIHHAKAIERGQSLQVSIFIGGPPAHMLSAIMPLPEGFPEIAFSGALNRRNFRFQRQNDGHLVSSEADFCIVGTVAKDLLLLEGPFGDHLGYYARQHDFPVLKVKAVYQKRNAIWPFTVVGRPPQEDSTFGALIHELTAPMVPVSIPGLKSMHAVDAAGVHPLMLAVGRESYVPYKTRKRPAELLTLANAILGFGQASLAKYVFIVAGEDEPSLKADQIETFFLHLLARVDLSRDLHFQTCTTMDTLDYSGEGLNEGSRLVVAAAGPPLRKLGHNLTALSDLELPARFSKIDLVMPGVLAIKGPAFSSYTKTEQEIRSLGTYLKKNTHLCQGFPLLVLTDDSTFCSKNLTNFLWICFTRSNPSHDVHGVDAFTKHKHWGCQGPLIIDARSKNHHAPLLVEDQQVERSVDALGAKNKSLHGII